MSVTDLKARAISVRPARHTRASFTRLYMLVLTSQRAVYGWEGNRRSQI